MRSLWSEGMCFVENMAVPACMMTLDKVQSSKRLRSFKQSDTYVSGGECLLTSANSDSHLEYSIRLSD